jgi:biopolymer transport protein TolR
MLKWQQREETVGQGKAEVNVTPLIDVSLCLVVILLLATPLAFESGFAVRRAIASSREGIDQSRQARIDLTILSEDSVRVNKQAIARRDLEPTLAAALAQSPNGLVTVDCADTVQHGTFVEVLDLAKLHGASEIAVVGR